MTQSENTTFPRSLARGDGGHKMTPSERAIKTARALYSIETTLSDAEVIRQAIVEAEREAYSRVLSVIEEHQEHDTFAHLDELKDEIMNLFQSTPPLKGDRPI